MTRLAMIAMVQKTVNFVDAKKTLDEEGIILTVETILRNYPTLTLEELRMTCDGMMTGRFGKFYERLKIQEFTECLSKTELDRSAYLERKHTRYGLDDVRHDPSKIKYEPQTMADVMKKNNPFYIPGKHKQGHE